MPLPQFLLTASGFAAIVLLLIAWCVWYDRSRSSFMRRARWAAEVETDHTDWQQDQISELHAEIDNLKLDLADLAANTKKGIELAHNNNQLNRNLISKLNTPPSGQLPVQATPAQNHMIGLNNAELNAAARPYTGPIPPSVRPVTAPLFKATS